MSSPFRLAPPRRPQRPALERPRLLEALDGRFARRLTVLRAGPGFGKTTLLAQAIASNAEDPLGTDVWLACAPPDDRAGELSAGLFAALGVQGPQRDAVRAVCDAIWKQSPRAVALVLDDVHYLSAGGSAAELLARLLAELPDNGHLALASRTEPPVPIARLEASGEACVIDEAELAFDESERSAFLTLRGATLPDGEFPGWPAVLELASSTGSARIDAYLSEEVLDRLGEARRRDLARLVGLDWIDADRIEAFTGRREEPATLLADLPLARFEPSGATRLHGLWATALHRDARLPGAGDRDAQR